MVEITMRGLYSQPRTTVAAAAVCSLDWMQMLTSSSCVLLLLAKANSSEL